MALYYSDLIRRETWLYRIYGGAPEYELLYVGISTNLPARMAKHRRRNWWQLARHMEVERFEIREEALAAERSAIHHENPVYNVSRPRMECC